MADRAPVRGAAPPGAVAWAGLVLICASAVLASLFELMLVPLYAGAVLIPLGAVLGVVGNIVLPLWGYRTVGSAKGAVLPVACWLVPLLALTVVNRPEGDLFVTAQYFQEWGYYALLLLGAIAGFGTIVRVTTPQR